MILILMIEINVFFSHLLPASTEQWNIYRLIAENMYFSWQLVLIIITVDGDVLSWCGFIVCFYEKFDEKHEVLTQGWHVERDSTACESQITRIFSLLHIPTEKIPKMEKDTVCIPKNTSNISQQLSFSGWLSSQQSNKCQSYA
jgi:hypothetical protein